MLFRSDLSLDRAGTGRCPRTGKVYADKRRRPNLQGFLVSWVASQEQGNSITTNMYRCCQRYRSLLSAPSRYYPTHSYWALLTRCPKLPTRRSWTGRAHWNRHRCSRTGLGCSTRRTRRRWNRPHTQWNRRNTRPNNRSNRTNTRSSRRITRSNRRTRTRRRSNRTPPNPSHRPGPSASAPPSPSRPPRPSPSRKRPPPSRPWRPPARPWP